ncbi:hypothetical protein EC968_007825 [Mortierella alpina]|nr:hypothetical protein EC968_007825 [Mortierella alpina]
MFSHSVLNTKAASSPASAAAAASAASAASSPAVPATARVALVPSEASALLLQSLLRENNITMPTSTPSLPPPLTSATAPSTSSNGNTVNHDFCLFEADENSFDYPLFAESIKLQHLHQHQQQQVALHQAAFVASNMANMFTPSSGNGGNSGGNTNPLCTPQTPSLDTMAGNLRPGGVDSLGFDGLATFFDEVSHCSNIHQGAHADAFGQVIAIGMDGTCAGIMAQHQQQHNAVQSLVNTPFTPYLDTPYETPYLGDFGLGNDECATATATEVLFGGCDVQPTSQSGGDTLMLFPAYGFELSAFESVDSATYGSTIEPSTLLMASPGTDHAVESSPAMSDIHEGLSLPVAHKSPSPTGTFYDGSEDNSNVDEDEHDLEVASSSSFSSPSLSCSVSDDLDDGMEDDDQSVEDPDDDEFIPSRPLAAAVSGFKRKALASFAPGRHSNDSEAPSSAAFKRTRPELASPYGGNAGPKKKRAKKASGSSKKKTATKRFSCIHPGCERQFARLYNLHTHEKTHDPLQVRPFVCSVVECSKRFSRKHDLQRHEASVHKGERNYGCPTCGKPFSRQDGLRRHLSLKGNNGNNPCAADIAESDDSSSLSVDASVSEIDTEWSAT